MKQILAAAAVAATMLAGTAAVHAAPIPIVPDGIVNPSNGNFAGTAPGNPNKTDPAITETQYFKFHIPLLGSYTVNGSLTTSPGSAVTFSAFNFTDLFGNVLEVGDEGIKRGPHNTVVPDPKNFTLDDYTFKFGDYLVAVTETGRAGDPSFNYGFTGNLSITMNPVPLPNTVALFGTAIAGLGVAGAMRRKSRAGTVA